MRYLYTAYGTGFGKIDLETGEVVGYIKCVGDGLHAGCIAYYDGYVYCALEVRASLKCYVIQIDAGKMSGAMTTTEDWADAVRVILTDCKNSGQITHDTSNGTKYLGNGVSLHQSCNFIMYGGSITGNNAGTGGGVYVSSDVGYITAAQQRRRGSCRFGKHWQLPCTVWPIIWWMFRMVFGASPFGCFFASMRSTRPLSNRCL